MEGVIPNEEKQNEELFSQAQRVISKENTWKPSHKKIKLSLEAKRSEA